MGSNNTIDSNIAYSKVDSLPNNMPLLKKILWGNKGLIRISPLNPKSRIKEFKIRRNMLQLHQKLGLATLSTMIYQTYIGHQMYEGNNFEKLRPIHKKLGYSVFGLYMGAASLSLFAPPAYKYSKKISSIDIHRLLAIIHFAGMLAQPWLGVQMANSDSSNDYEYYRDMHYKVGYITITSFSVSFLTTLLP